MVLLKLKQENINYQSRYTAVEKTLKLLIIFSICQH